MAGVPAALARAQHAIAAGEARHPAMKRIEAAEWEAARAFAERVLEALSPLTSKAEERLSLREWLAAHGAVLARSRELGLAAVLSEEDKPSTLVEAAKVAARSLKLDLAGYAELFRRDLDARGKGPPRRTRIRGFFCGGRSMRACLPRM